MEDKQTGVAYALLAVTAFGLAGLHRFYLGRPITGLIWVLTWGLLGIGTLFDLILIPGMVARENRRLGFREAALQLAPPRPSPPPESPEQAILAAAKRNAGRLTVATAALETGLSLRKAKAVLEQMKREGFADPDVSTEGADLYVFRGLISTDPFEVS